MALRSYKSMLSLLQLVENIKLQSRYDRLRVDGQQVKDLAAAIDYLLNFLEGLPPRLSPELEVIAGKIDDMAFKARNVIDVRAVDQLRGAHRGEIDGGLSWLRRDLGMVFHDIVLIEVEIAMILSELAPLFACHRPLDSRNSISRTPVANLVGFDDHILRLKNELTSNQKACAVIPVVGMGGCGKTTLARHIFEDQAMKWHFDRCLWITVSQEYALRKLLRSALDDLHVDVKTEEISELGTLVYQNLRGCRYLVVLDDVWSFRAWYDFKQYLPEQGNRSRVILTTRNSDVAALVCPTLPLQIGLLSGDDSWELLRQRVFGAENCPPELEEIGKDIARNCKGLPLSIVTISGMLLNSTMTVEFWESVSGNVLSALLNSENDKYCMNVLLLSYESLPINLRLCFLQFGGYAEDAYIFVESIIGELVMEAVIRPKPRKTLQEAANDCVGELIARNLLLVKKLDEVGDIQWLGIHDMLLELCRTKGQHEELHARSLGSYDKIANAKGQELVVSGASICMRCSCLRKRCGQIESRCLGSIFHQIRCLRVIPSTCSECSDKPYELVHDETEAHIAEFLDSPPARCFYDCKSEHPHLHALNEEIPILSVEEDGFVGVWKNLVKFTSPLVFLWNLMWYYASQESCEYAETVKRYHGRETLNMPQLTAAMDCGLQFFFMSSLRIHKSMVLKQLDTLAVDGFFKDMAQVVPNLRRLLVNSSCDECDRVLGEYIEGKVQPDKFTASFPHSLKILELDSCYIGRDQMEAIAMLPNLDALKLRSCSFDKNGGRVLVEGGFQCLRSLSLISTPFKLRRARALHFPMLRSLKIKDELEIEPRSLFQDERIHPDMGNIETLRSIKVRNCYNAVGESARKILKQQWRLGNESLCVEIDRQVVTVDVDEEDLSDDDEEDDDDVVEEADGYDYDEDELVFFLASALLSEIQADDELAEDIDDDGYYLF